MNTDYLSQMPPEILDTIFKFCSDEHSGEPYPTFVQYQYGIDKRTYLEYQGEMDNGQPHGYGTMYTGSTQYAEPVFKNIDVSGYKTFWMYVPLLYVYPKFKPILIKIEDSK